MLSRSNAPQPRGGGDKRLDAESLRLVSEGSVVGMCPGKAGEERRNSLDLRKPFRFDQFAPAFRASQMNRL